MEGAARLLSEDHAGGPAARRRADARAGAPRRTCCDAALGARRALGLRLDRRREPAAGAALGERRRRQLRPRLPQPRRRRRRRPAADGLRDGDRLGPRGGGRALALLRDASTTSSAGLDGQARLLRGARASTGAPPRREIKKAFRRLARELHPDVNAHDPEAEEKFKEAAEAYEVLSDPERRRTYDAFGHEGLRSGGWTLADGRLRRASRTSSSAFFGGDRSAAASASAARRRGRRRRSRWSRSTLAEVLDGTRARGHLRGGRRLRALPRQRRRARDPDPDLRACGGSGQIRE